MNQILNTKVLKNVKKSRQFIVQLFVSIFAVDIFVTFYLFFKINQNKELQLSQNFSNNYEVYKLYSQNTIKKNQKESDILGNISIPKINLNYPFFSGLTDKLLKISPCKFYGQMPNIKSNLCIAGHNYDDSRFFGRINELEKNDEIIIENNFGIKFLYNVYDKYEVNENDLSPIRVYDNNKCTLTLVTCNNLNKKRIIIKAQIKT